MGLAAVGCLLSEFASVYLAGLECALSQSIQPKPCMFGSSQACYPGNDTSAPELFYVHCIILSISI